MRTSILIATAAAGFVAITVGVPKPAEARCWNCLSEAALAEGLIGGSLVAVAVPGHGYGWTRSGPKAYAVSGEATYVPAIYVPRVRRVHSTPRCPCNR